MTMTKTKQKSKETVLDFWWNEFLFRKHFSFETSLSPDECAAQIKHMDIPFIDWWSQQIRTTNVDIDVQPDGESSYIFELQAKRKSKRSYYTTATANGFVYADQRGTTMVVGTVKLGILYHILFLVMIAGGMFYFTRDFLQRSEFYSGSGFPFPLWILVIFGLYGFYWLRMLFDRNALVDYLRDAVLREKAKHDG